MSKNDGPHAPTPHCTICEIVPATPFDTICYDCRAAQKRGERRMIGLAVAFFAGAPLLIGIIYGARF